MPRDGEHGLGRRVGGVRGRDGDQDPAHLQARRLQAHAWFVRLSEVQSSLFADIQGEGDLLGEGEPDGLVRDESGEDIY